MLLRSVLFRVNVDSVFIVCGGGVGFSLRVVSWIQSYVKCGINNNRSQNPWKIFVHLRVFQLYAF